MEKAFQSTRGGAPFPRSANEWIEKGMEPAQAENRMRQEVFGHDHKVDASGKPVEQGKGSAAQPTAQHLQAKQIAEDGARQHGMRMGYHGGLEGAFDPRIQDQIDRAVAAAMRKKPAAQRRGKKAKASPAPVEN